MKREESIRKLFANFRRCYNISEEGQTEGLLARCDYFEENEKYVISRKAQLWAANREEFLYLFSVDHLTEELYAGFEKQAVTDGMSRLNVGPGHMSSFITAVVVCDSCDEAAAQALKKSRLHKSFHFSLHGWMDYRAVLIISDQEKIFSNGAGKPEVKILKKVLL